MINTRNILLYLTALTTPICLIADMPTVTIGGRMDTMYGFVNQKKEYRNAYSDSSPLFPTGKVNKSGIANDTKIDIKIKGELDDIEYGGLIRLNADTSKTTTGETGSANKTMLYIQHNKIGKIELGSDYGAAGKFEMDTPLIEHAAYGVNGFWSKWASENAYINLSSLPYQGLAFMLNDPRYSSLSDPIIAKDLMGYKYIVTPNLPSNYSGLYYCNAPKVSVYTVLSDFTFGLSYIPDLDSTGTIATRAPKNGGPTDPVRGPRDGRPGTRSTFKNIFSGGFQYNHEFNSDTSVKASAVGEVGVAKKYANTNLTRGLRAYELGFKVTHQDVQVSASYGSWINTATYKEKFAGTKQNSNYWTLGFAHQIEDFGYSVSYMQSKKAGGLEAVGGQFQHTFNQPVKTDVNFSDRKYNKFNNISFGIDYTLAPGVLPYAEISFFKFKEASALVGNKGSVGFVGFRLLF